MCLECHSSCSTCSSGAAGGCLTCPGSNVLRGPAPNTCGAACLTPSFYIDNGVCLACHSSCSTCSSGAAGGCLTCPGSNVLLGPAPNTCGAQAINTVKILYDDFMPTQNKDQIIGIGCNALVDIMLTKQRQPLLNSEFIELKARADQ